jgi:hypothetical protein
MRRAIVVLSVVAIVALAASSVQAGFVFGDYYFSFTNWGQSGGDSDGLGPAFQTGGWNATNNGAIWIKTGSTYALNVNDFNAEIDFRAASNQSTIVITNTCLLSTGVAVGDVAPFGPAEAYPGYFLGDDGDSGWGNTHLDPSPYAQGGGQYWLPETAGFASFQFDLKLWQGNYPSFSAAQAAHANGADTGWFAAGPMAVGIEQVGDSTFVNMPSVVLQPLTATPEPSTIILVLSGVVGLLAYAWRRRR